MPAPKGLRFVSTLRVDKSGARSSSIGGRYRGVRKQKQNWNDSTLSGYDCMTDNPNYFLVLTPLRARA